MANKKLLMLAYYYPPYANVSSMRASKFAKYLPSNGWSTTVLTVDPRYYGSRRIARDSRPAATREGPEVAHSAFVHFPGNTLMMKLAYPFLAFFWILRNRSEIDRVYMTGSPFHPFLLTGPVTGILGIPTVLDFRDSWSINHGYDGNSARSLKSKVKQTLLKQLERFSIRFATHVIFTTSRLEEEYATLHPAWRQKYSVITNGYDPEDLHAITPRRLHAAPTIVIAGQFNIYTPSAVEALMTYLGGDRRTHLVYIGTERAIMHAAALKMGVADYVDALGYMPYREALALIAGADVALLSNGMCNGLGTKIFDSEVSAFR
jgi:glycosyltransferase involved in cell wall biosynthesis